MLVVNLYYLGRNGNAKAYAEEMLARGLVDAIRKEKGCISYEYYYPENNPDEVLLVDKWVDEEALEAHHNTPIMEEIIKLHRKYNLTLKVEKFSI